jgi:hypothetical protein
MTETFDTTSDAGTDHGAGRYQAQLENALLAKAIAETGNADERQALLSAWLIGTFNATMFGITRIEDGYGMLDWVPDGNAYRLLWIAPTGLACPLAQVYQQPDGSWASLVVAGVRDDLPAAMAAAEWAVGRLTG